MLRDLTRERAKVIAREEAFMLRFDAKRTLEALPRMQRTEKERREAIEIARRIGDADREITPEVEAVLERVGSILGVDKPAEAKPLTKAARRRRAGAAAR